MRLITTVTAVLLGIGSASAADIPANWVDVMAGPMFTVKAPPGTTFERIRTGDAFAGTFHGAGFDLAVEFGYHREDVKTPNTVAMPQMQKVVIDEKPGTITTGSVTDPAHPVYVGLLVPSVETDVIGPMSLVVSGQVAKPEDRATVERIYESITFGYKN